MTKPAYLITGDDPTLVSEALLELARELVGSAYPFLNTGLRQNNEFAFHALAIDDLRLIIDSMNGVDDSLEVAIAIFHERMAPRLRLVGIELTWTAAPGAPAAPAKPAATTPAATSQNAPTATPAPAPARR